MDSAQALQQAFNVEVTKSDFAEIAALMQHEARIHLAETKIALVHSRLSKRVRERGLTRFSDYVALVKKDKEELSRMVVALTTNHTHFFREAHHFDHLRQVVMPELKAHAEEGRPVRIWSAGCSSGEEVYTIAMCLLGQDRGASSWVRQGDVKLLATDIAPTMVSATRRAVYTEAMVQPVPSVYRSLWMQPEGEDYAMTSDAKSLVTANVLNLFAPWPLRRKYDVIFCRNVMIYFDDKAKMELEARFVDLLAPGGYLYIGHSERLNGEAARVMQRAGQTVFVKPAGGLAA
ncbi:CheR family methyltransferase [Iodidimonas sp. SYSU 1G8]|uniref:CheR family methyltransferase n=1 Tax=Iodidimonas sp. SYSU 1G8 TaxID=3133967 RepID=UPI0031FF33DE